MPTSISDRSTTSDNRRDSKARRLLLGRWYILDAPAETYSFDLGGHMRRRATLAEQLAQVPLFSGLTQADLQALANGMARVKEPVGAVLTKEGERGHEFLLVLDGEVAVSHDERVIATLRAGDWLGELALLDDDTRRTATVVAQTNVEIGFLGRRDFDRLLAELPEVASRIGAIAATRRAELNDRTQ